MTRIEDTVAEYLAGASREHLEQILAHGIHNITNEFNGETDDEYESFQSEFQAQAEDALKALSAE